MSILKNTDNQGTSFLSKDIGLASPVSVVSWEYVLVQQIEVQKNATLV